MLMRRASNVGGEFNALIQRDPRAYALGYRKERIVFDCLSENIVKVSSSVQGVATPAEIDKRIGDFAANECKDWLRHQFVSDDKKMPDQQPVPLRTVWTKAGPLDDPSITAGRPERYRAVRNRPMLPTRQRTDPERVDPVKPICRRPFAARR